jgi:hypothetical protein
MNDVDADANVNARMWPQKYICIYIRIYIVHRSSDIRQVHLEQFGA